VNAEIILGALLRAQLIGTAAILLVLLLRRFGARQRGATINYWMWLIVPMAVAASALPPRERVMTIAPMSVVAGDAATQSAPGPLESSSSSVGPAVQQASGPSAAEWAFGLWLLGAGVLLTRSIYSTRRLASDPSAGPALVGVLRPRLLLPADFSTRFNTEECALILAHEEVHRISGHTVINGLLELARSLSWFNPLAHVAARCVREDQELACDAQVIATHPTQRRTYAEALLKTQIAASYLPLGCTWTSASARRLGERIQMLDQAPRSRSKKMAAAGGIAMLGSMLGYGAWAQQSEKVVTQVAEHPEAVWVSSANAPRGALSTALEADRHDRAIKLAQRGQIDMVLFGTTNSEMFWWKDRGRPVWDKHFGKLKAANFGSQGTQRDSLIWRMRHGELSGFQAKLVIVQTWLGAGGSATREQVVGIYAPIIAEIRQYQPQAKILLFADFPRGELNHDMWRKVAKENAASFAPLVDNKNVFYADIGERFFLSSGIHDQKLWRYPAISGMYNAGMQAAGFEVWAEELQPWIDRFVLKR